MHRNRQRIRNRDALDSEVDRKLGVEHEPSLAQQPRHDPFSNSRATAADTARESTVGRLATMDDTHMPDKQSLAASIATLLLTLPALGGLQHGPSTLAISGCSGTLWQRQGPTLLLALATPLLLADLVRHCLQDAGLWTGPSSSMYRDDCDEVSGIHGLACLTLVGWLFSILFTYRVSLLPAACALPAVQRFCADDLCGVLERQPGLQGTPRLVSDPGGDLDTAQAMPLHSAMVQVCGASGSGQQVQGQGQAAKVVIAERRQVIKAGLRGLVEAARPDLSPAHAVVAEVNKRMTMGSKQCVLAAILAAGIWDPQLLAQIRDAMELLTKASVLEHLMRGPHHHGIKLLPCEVAVFEQPSSAWLVAKLQELDEVHLQGDLNSLIANATKIRSSIKEYYRHSGRFIKWWGKAFGVVEGGVTRDAQKHFSQLVLDYSLPDPQHRWRLPPNSVLWQPRWLAEVAKHRRLLGLTAQWREGQDSMQSRTCPLPFTMLPMVGVRAQHFVIDDRVLHGLLTDLGMTTLTRAQFEADSLPHWQRFIQYSQLQNNGWEFARSVETDGVSTSAHFMSSQAVKESVELPIIGRQLTATGDFNPTTHIAVGVDPDVTQAIKAAHAQQHPVTGQLQQLADATPAGTTLDGPQAHIQALKATWDQLWEEDLRPRWRRQRLALYHAQDPGYITCFLKTSMQSTDPMFPPGSQETRMLSGLPYHQCSSVPNGRDQVLLDGRKKARRLLRELEMLSVYEDVARKAVMTELFGSIDPVGGGGCVGATQGPGQVLKASPPFLETGFKCDFGSNISFGSDVFVNYNAVILDCGKVTIGSRVLFGPNVQLLGATHPAHPVIRNGTQGPEFGCAITICDDVWLGAGATIMPNVTVGAGALVGAGAVVTRDVEPLSVVAGNPARLLRRLAAAPTKEEVEFHTVTMKRKRPVSPAQSAAGASGSGQQVQGQGQAAKVVIAERRQVIKAGLRGLVEAARPDLSPAPVDAVVAEVNKRMTMGSKQCVLAAILCLAVLLQSFLGQPTPGFPAAGPAPGPPPPPDPACPPYAHPRLPARNSPRTAAAPAQLPPPVQLDIWDPQLLAQIRDAMELLTKASVLEHLMRGPHHRGIRLLPGEVAVFEQPSSAWLVAKLQELDEVHLQGDLNSLIANATKIRPSIKEYYRHSRRFIKWWGKAVGVVEGGVSRDAQKHFPQVVLDYSLPDPQHSSLGGWQT
ncbi:hypothetical protein QJQ45_024960 [Haematococcus lacustris]|nr:hypothetical protein QJQ45_024960 [Haematococcus lacustris]